MAAKITLVLSESSVSTANNTSVVTAKLYYYGNGVSWNNGGCTGYVIIDGTTYSFSGATITTSTSAQLITTKSKTVTHNSNGAKTVSVSAKLETDTSSAGTLTTSSSITLTTINRTSSLSLDKTSVAADGSTTVTATATKTNSSLTDTIVVKLGDYSQTVTSGTAFTIPMTWNNAIPSATSSTATVTVTTKSGSTTVGTKSVNLTITVPDSVKPTISDISVTDTNTIIANAFPNTYLSNLSELKFDINASGAYSSTISKYSSTFNSKTYTDSSFTVGTLSANSYTINTTVTDSRGRTATYSKTVNVVSYISDLSLSATSVLADGSTTITATATKKASTLTDTIVVKLGDYSQTVTSGTAFTIPMTWNNAIPSATSSTATVTVTTMLESTTIGIKTVNLSVIVPDSVKPTISDISVTDINTAVANAFPNTYLSSLSKLKFDITADDSYSSTITDYSTTFNSKTYTDSSFTVGNLSANSYTVNTTVTDSRNRTTTYSETVTVVSYLHPTISDIDIIRCDANGNVDVNGTASKVIVSGAISSVNDLNTKSLVIKYRKKGTTDYTTTTIIPTDYTFTESYIATNIEYPAAYEYVVALSDKINTFTQTRVIGLPTISRLSGGGGVTLFGDASEQGFVIDNNMPSYFTGEFLIDDEELDTLGVELGINVS